MPPLSAQEQDDEQGNNEAENGGAFCQGAAQQQGAVDLSGRLRLAGNGLAGLSGGKADADTVERLLGEERPFRFIEEEKKGFLKRLFGG